MKFKTIYILVFALLLSCTSEDNLIETTSKPTPSLRSKKMIEKNKRFPWYIPTISGCGGGFNVTIASESGFVPTGQLFSYEIYLEDTYPDGAILDSGEISSGENTNWVLAPCTTYVFVFHNTPWSPTITVTGITDGCGGIFIC
ncbi:hypothetical protein [Tenacibaculum agarivorans]|uniref:hypothetical protein n=1 Tax=Tenacibaculum agarivorans TaxID=1908389 RepID=UPI00094B9B89|nr:hypothetical protein [Tenacibaculum agarivorans]